MKITRDGLSEMSSLVCVLYASFVMVARGPEEAAYFLALAVWIMVWPYRRTR